MAESSNLAFQGFMLSNDALNCFCSNSPKTYAASKRRLQLQFSVQGPHYAYDQNEKF